MNKLANHASSLVPRPSASFCGFQGSEPQPLPVEVMKLEGGLGTYVVCRGRGGGGGVGVGGEGCNSPATRFLLYIQDCYKKYTA